MIINIHNYKRLDGESDEELIYRVTGDKEEIGSWQAVADILNDLLGTEYTESKFRKQRQAFDKMLAANQSKFVDTESQLKEIDIKMRELERKKIAYRDERRSWNRQNYLDERFNEVMDIMLERLDNFSRTDFRVNPTVVSSGDKSMIVCLSDLHIGQTFSSHFGEFNSDIARERLEKYLNEVIDVGLKNDVKKVYICMLGDNISNSLHKTIEVSNKENVIDQLKLSVEYITSFCYELTKYFEKVFLSSSSGNHSRLQAKDLAQHSERLDAFIAWDVCRVLEKQPNFHSLLHRTLDDGISDINIDGKTYLMVHGDFDNATKDGYMKLATMCGFFPDYILSGHKHFCFYSQESKFIQSGSLSGSGCDYTIEKRLSGKPSQMVCICDGTGVKSVHPIILG